MIVLFGALRWAGLAVLLFTLWEFLGHAEAPSQALIGLTVAGGLGVVLQFAIARDGRGDPDLVPATMLKFKLYIGLGVALVLLGGWSLIQCFW